MNEGRYAAFNDPYCYKGSDVLKNRAGLRDADLLEGFELEMAHLRADEPLPDGDFDAAHYRALHYHLFQDVYKWAGQYRSVRITKGNSHFCYPDFVKPSMATLFTRLQAAPFLPGSPFETFIQGAADFLAELNHIHPFREGNGRCQLSFMLIAAVRAGHPLAMRRVQRGTFLPAMIESFYGRLDPLIAALTALGNA